MVRELTGLLDINGVVIDHDHFEGHLDERSIREVLEESGFGGLRGERTHLGYRPPNRSSAPPSAYATPDSEVENG